MSTILAYSAPMLFVLLACGLTWQAWRIFRDAVGWHVQQRLYGVRGLLYDKVRSGDLSFEDPNVDKLIQFLHSGIEISRSRRLRRAVLEAATAPGEISEEARREILPFLYDERLRLLGAEATWHLHKCLIVELFSRYFWAIIPATLLLAGAAVSRRASNLAVHLSSGYSAPLALAR